MKIISLDQKVTISDQINVDDVDTLVKNGVEVIVCNRPDNEAAKQPLFSDIQSAAEAKGIKAVNIPFTSGKMTAVDVDEFQKIRAGYNKIHAYCRTGNRSNQLWQAATAQQQAKSDTKENSKAYASSRYDIIIMGAGSGGVAVASSLLKRKPQLRIALIDPAEKHYYQPGWTMVGGGVFDAPSTCRTMKSVIPNGVEWIAQSIEAFAPDSHKVILSDQREMFYEHLVVSPGLTLNWQAVEGLEQALGQNGVTSNYRYDLAPYTWQLVQSTTRGKAIFTQPPMPIKCAGAPQKALYLSADHWFKTGRLKDIAIDFYNAGPVLFGVADYVPALMSYIEKYQANLHFSHNLVKIDGQEKRAWFSQKDENGQEKTVEAEFDMIHVCPPQCAPAIIKESALSDAAGWLDVDQYKLQHKQYANIWGVGDVINTPNAKTMAAVRKQAPVVAENICNLLDDKPVSASYNGYGSCPLTVEKGKIVLAEFGYGGKLVPTFPEWMNKGTQPTTFAWMLKAHVLPSIYWNAMLKGKEILAAPEKLTTAD